MMWLVALHAVIAAIVPVAGRRLGRNVFFLAAAAPAATLAWIAAVAPGVLDGQPVVEQHRWVPALGLSFASRADAFALLMILLIAGIGVLVLVYSRWYFSPRPDVGRLAGTITAFAGSMLGLVLSDNLLVLYLFWELTSVTSFLLIGFEDEKREARSAAVQAFLVTGAGGLAMLAGFVLLGQAAGTYSLSGILADPPGGGTVAPALLLVLLGAFTKSAQVPFHFWLPAAMAAPTPVSTYLHSATMVKAGVYLVARLAPAFAVTQGYWRPLVVGVGLATMLLGGLRALRQNDLKLLLAYGTVSQLGFMVALLGAGRPELTYAGAAVVLAHGLFKATLFLVVGIVDHQAHTRDLRRLSGLASRMPATFAVASVGVASMAGLPPLFGFVAKEAAFEAVLHTRAAWIAALCGMVAGSALTVAYGARFLHGAFAGKAADGDPTRVGAAVSPPSAAFLAPAAVLGVLTLAVGLIPAAVNGLVTASATALDPSGIYKSLALWHGVNPALGLSGISLLGGLALFRGGAALERPAAVIARWPAADDGYRASVTGLVRVADRVTGIVQNGSLPTYLTVILAAAVALPGTALLFGTAPPLPELAENPLQAAVGALVLGAALGTAGARRRFVAVLFLGAVGFGVAVLFLLHGAPDLALTQLLIETLVLVIFVLVLRHLPDRFEPAPWRIRRATRLLLSLGVGAFVAVFSLVAAGSRTGDPISTAYAERALPEAGGRNVVNVILVDFRGFDTLGEITVLTVAAMGITSLVMAGRRASP